MSERSPECFGHYIIPILSFVSFHFIVWMFYLLRQNLKISIKILKKICLTVSKTLIGSVSLQTLAWSLLKIYYYVLLLLCQTLKIYNSKLGWILFHSDKDNVTLCPEGGDRHAPFVAKPLPKSISTPTPLQKKLSIAKST